MSARARQAVILAAGRGSRLGAAGDAQPKCLVPLAGQPVLQWTLSALRKAGIERMLVVAGWKHEALEGWGTELRVNPAWQSTNMVASLRLARDWLLREPTLMVYGDGAYGSHAVDAAASQGSGDIVVPVDRHWERLWRRRFADPLSDAESLRHDGGHLLEIGGKASALAGIQGQFMGLVRWTPAGWRSAEAWLQAQDAAATARLDMTSLLRALLRADVPIGTVTVEGGWVEIDSLADLAAAEEGLDEPGWQHDFRR